jgi:hypothetical protein
MAVYSKDRYDSGDLVLIDDKRGFRELVIVISPKIPMYHKEYEFYQVFSIKEGVSYVVPCDLVIGEYIQ